VFSLTPPKTQGGAWTYALLNEITETSGDEDPGYGVIVSKQGRSLRHHADADRTKRRDCVCAGPVGPASRDVWLREGDWLLDNATTTFGLFSDSGFTVHVRQYRASEAGHTSPGQEWSMLSRTPRRAVPPPRPARSYSDFLFQVGGATGMPEPLRHLRVDAGHGQARTALAGTERPAHWGT